MKKMMMNLMRFGFLVAMLAGCGSNNNCPSGQSMVNNQCTYSGLATTAQGNCTVGLVQTQYGCLAQGNCAIGMASYNGSCVQATTAYGSQYGSQYGVGGQYGQQQGGYVQTSMGYLPSGTCPYPYGYIVIQGQAMCVR